MPPGFMNAIDRLGERATTDASVSWASAMRSPSADSPAGFLAASRRR